MNEVMLDLDSRLYAGRHDPGVHVRGVLRLCRSTTACRSWASPFDPSLPDASLPSLASTFVDEIHYTPAVYGVFADDLYVAYYEELFETACVADVNADGMLSPADFSARSRPSTRWPRVRPERGWHVLAGGLLGVGGELQRGLLSP